MPGSVQRVDTVGQAQLSAQQPTAITRPGPALVKRYQPPIEQIARRVQLVPVDDDSAL